MSLAHRRGVQGRKAGVQGVARPALLKAARVVRCNTTAAVPSRPGVVSRHAIVCNAIVEPQQAAPAKVGVLEWGFWFF
jgi:hypothetical protein